MTPVARSAVSLLVGILIFAGLPLVGWGLLDLGGFAAHPARLGYVVVVVLVQWFVVIRFPGIGRTGGEGTRTVRRQRWVVLLMQVLSIAIVVAAPYSDRWGIAVLSGFDAGRYLGLVVFGLGFVAMNWAEAALGSQFSVQVTVQEGHHLVVDGPYRYVRHPRYLGIIAYNLGVALVFRSWLALALLAALTLVLLWRIHDEEAFMRQEFGAEWEAYAGRSSRLIPRVY